MRRPFGSVRKMIVALCAPVLLLTAAPSSASAQVVEGRTTDETSGEPLGAVEIRLLTADQSVANTAVSDSSGAYELEIPTGGAYYVQADMLGYQRLRSPLLELSTSRRFTADFELPPDPIELEGLDVEVEAMARIERELVSYGVRLDDLGERFVSAADIARRPTALDFGKVLQWQSIPGLQVLRGDDLTPPAYWICVRLQIRGGCAVMVLNGARITLEAAYDIPAHVLRAIVVLRPEESTLLYGTDGGSGAVLLFTR
jgi:hypothetical protein